MAALIFIGDYLLPHNIVSAARLSVFLILAAWLLAPSMVEAQTVSSCPTATSGSVWSKGAWLPCPTTVAYIAQPVPVAALVGDMRFTSGGLVFSWQPGKSILPADLVWVKTTASPAGTWVHASTLQLATAPVTQSLQISGAPPTTAGVGQFYSFSPNVVSPAGSSVTYVVSNKPAWAQFGAATGTLSGTPSTGSAATDANIVISVLSGTQSASLPAFNITVQPAAPTAAGAAILSWSRPTKNTDGSPLMNLAGFVIRYGTGSAALLDKQISITSASATSAEVSNLSTGYWYFKVCAINAANLQSEFSAIVGKAIQ